MQRIVIWAVLADAPQPETSLVWPAIAGAATGFFVLITGGFSRPRQ